MRSGDPTDSPSRRRASVPKTPARVVDDEARRVFGAYGAVSHALTQRKHCIGHLGVGQSALDDLHNFHQGNRVEKIKTPPHPGCAHAAAMAVTDSDEVLVANTVSVATMASSC